MAFNDQPRMERVMHKAGDSDGCAGGWTCSKCGNEIAELPFAPDPNRLSQLLCRDCHRAARQSFRR